MTTYTITTDLDILRTIERRDPDGGTRRPTAADYAAHEEWAIATYGEKAWRDYRHGGWAPAIWY